MEDVAETGRVLVALDGSELAETVMPLAIAVAQALKAEVALLHVLEHKAPSKVHGQHHLTGLTEAEEYLVAVGEQSPANGPAGQDTRAPRPPSGRARKHSRPRG